MASLSHSGGLRPTGGPQPTIALIGFMGAGKTRAGRGIADVLGEPFADSDEELERRMGAPVSEIFERDGEAAFREAEEQAVLELLGRGGVVALGGGACASERIRDALAECFTCWCRVDEETAWKRASKDGDRPLARDRERFASLLRARTPVYGELGRAVLGSGGERSGRGAARWLRAAASLDDSRLAWAESRSGSYPAIVAPGAMSALAAGTAGASNGTPDPRPQRWFGVADAAAFAHHGYGIEGIDAWIEVRGGEQSKTLTEAERVLSQLAQRGTRRDDGILALGGGVVGDLAGFCAATYQRGVPVIQAPTTLVAQVDSAYGGKTGVDLPEAKNYAGAYHMPLAVLCDPGYLKTLPAPELAAGFAEVVKTALLKGGDLWERVRAIERLDAGALADVVFNCALTKIDVVGADERDSGARQQLNLGHTVGHAIEATAGYGTYRHGEAVALGLLAALRLSGAAELRAEVAALFERTGLPTHLRDPLDAVALLDALGRDKKRTAAGIGFVLLERPGEPLIGEAVDEAMVIRAVEELT